MENRSVLKTWLPKRAVINLFGCELLVMANLGNVAVSNKVINNDRSLIS